MPWSESPTQLERDTHGAGSAAQRAGQAHAHAGLEGRAPAPAARGLSHPHPAASDKGTRCPLPTRRAAGPGRHRREAPQRSRAPGGHVPFETRSSEGGGPGAPVPHAPLDRVTHNAHTRNPLRPSHTRNPRAHTHIHTRARAQRRTHTVPGWRGQRGAPAAGGACWAAAVGPPPRRPRRRSRRPPPPRGARPGGGARSRARAGGGARGRGARAAAAAAAAAGLCGRAWRWAGTSRERPAPQHVGLALPDAVPLLRGAAPPGPALRGGGADHGAAGARRRLVGRAEGGRAARLVPRQLRAAAGGRREGGREGARGLGVRGVAVAVAVSRGSEGADRWGHCGASAPEAAHGPGGRLLRAAPRAPGGAAPRAGSCVAEDAPAEGLT